MGSSNTRLGSWSGAHRRKLLCSTALGAVLLLAAPSASRAQQTPITVSIGGYFEGYGVGSAEQSGIVNGLPQPGYGYRTFGIFQRSRIQFEGLGTIGPDTHAGFQIRMRGESNVTDQMEGAYLFFDAPLGRLELGKTVSAPNKMFYGAPTPIPGFGANSPDFMPAHLPAANFASSPVSFISFGPGYVYDRQEKVTLFTPRYQSGFQFGASYSPSACMIGQVPTTIATAPYYCGIDNAFAIANFPSVQQNIIEVGASWIGDFGGGNSLSTYVGAGTAKLAAQYPAGNNLRDQQEVGAGFSLQWKNWTIGADFRWNNLGANYGYSSAATGPLNLANQQWDWEVGAMYAIGKLNVGAAFHQTLASVRTPANTPAGDDKLWVLTLGGNYEIGPGIVLAGGAQPFKLTSYTGLPNLQNQGVSYILGTTLTF